MSNEVIVSIVYHESRYSTYQAYIDPDHYEGVMGEPLRGSHPDLIERYMHKHSIDPYLVDEESDTIEARWVDVDRIEEWRYD